MKRALLFLLLCSFALSLPNFAKRITKGFRLSKLQLAFPHHAEWEIAPNPAINEILKQNFTFLGKGTQSYVFESEDGKYVIKLFRYDQPSSKNKIVLLFNACKIAYDHLQSETGLVYIHLNPTPMNLPILHFQDAVYRRYEIPLDHYRFALQKRAEPFTETLVASRRNPQLMKKRLDQFLTLLKTRTGKGIFNSDPSLSRNFGFLEDQSIEFDFGNYRYSHGADESAEINRFNGKLRYWLEKHAPEWISYFEEQIK